MFILDGKPLSPDVAFTATDSDGQLIQFPANWLRLASPEEREAIGITEQPDPAPVDQRFWWDTGIPKDHAQLVEQWVAQTKATAGSMLAPTDWMITRSAEPGGKPASAAVLAQRAAIRAKSDEKEAAIEATSSTEELAAYITSSAYSSWSEEEPAPVVDGNDTLSFEGGVTSGQIVM
jgi:hypothetical protein